MPTRDEGTIRAWADAYNARDIDGLLEHSDEEIQFRSIFAALDSDGVFSGRGGIEDYFRTIDEAYESFQVDLGQPRGGREGYLVSGIASWRGRGSGAEGTTPILVAYTMREGKVLIAETFTDERLAMESVGIDA